MEFMAFSWKNSNFTHIQHTHKHAYKDDKTTPYQRTPVLRTKIYVHAVVSSAGFLLYLGFENSQTSC